MIAGIGGATAGGESGHPVQRLGNGVNLNGFSIGENHKVRLAERAWLNGDWLVPLPSATRQAMVIGAAGYDDENDSSEA